MLGDGNDCVRGESVLGNVTGRGCASSVSLDSAEVISVPGDTSDVRHVGDESIRSVFNGIGGKIAESAVFVPRVVINNSSLMPELVRTACKATTGPVHILRTSESIPPFCADGYTASESSLELAESIYESEVVGSVQKQRGKREPDTRSRDQPTEKLSGRPGQNLRRSQAIPCHPSHSQSDHIQPGQSKLGQTGSPYQRMAFTAELESELRPKSQYSFGMVANGLVLGKSTGPESAMSGQVETLSKQTISAVPKSLYAGPESSWSILDDPFAILPQPMSTGSLICQCHQNHCRCQPSLYQLNVCQEEPESGPKGELSDFKSTLITADQGGTSSSRGSTCLVSAGPTPESGFQVSRFGSSKRLWQKTLLMISGLDRSSVWMLNMDLLFFLLYFSWHYGASYSSTTHSLMTCSFSLHRNTISPSRIRSLQETNDLMEGSSSNIY